MPTPRGLAALAAAALFLVGSGCGESTGQIAGARIELHIEHGDTVSGIDRLEVLATRSGDGNTMSRIIIHPTEAFFGSCSSNVVQILLGSQAPADVDIGVQAWNAADALLGQGVAHVHVGADEVRQTTVWLGSGVMVPPCDNGPPDGGADGSGDGGGDAGALPDGGIPPAGICEPRGPNDLGNCN